LRAIDALVITLASNKLPDTNLLGYFCEKFSERIIAHIKAEISKQASKQLGEN
jgi:hypothetical protein